MSQTGVARPRLRNTKVLLHRWDTDKTYRERQSAQCLWTRDDAIMYDVSIQFALKLAKENFNNPEFKFSWEYRQTADFRRRYRPWATVPSRHGGSGTFSHRHPPTAAQCGGVGTRPQTALVGFEEGPRKPQFAGGDPKASDTSMADAQEAKPGQTDEEFARELSDHQYAMQLQYREESRSSRWYDSPVGGDFSANAWSHARRGACWNCGYPGHHAKYCPVSRDAPYAKGKDKGSGKRSSADESGETWSAPPWKSSRSSSSTSAAQDDQVRRNNDEQFEAWKRSKRDPQQ